MSTEAEEWAIHERMLEARMEAVMRNGNDGLHYEEEEGMGKDAVSTVLSERGKRYGCFSGHAKLSQGFKVLMHESVGWSALSDDQAESLEMIVHKIARILNGDPDYPDSWLDIASYARLVHDRLVQE